MSSLAEIAGGVLVELVLFGVIGLVLYRNLAGRFLVPKREVVLPNQRAVLVQGSQVVRVVEPGVCLVRPRQKLILFDARPRPVQFIGLEVLSSDGKIVRLSVSGEFVLEDPAVYYQGSTNANEAFLTEIRMILIGVARSLTSEVMTSMHQALTRGVMEQMKPRQQSLGLVLRGFEIREAVHVGQIAHTSRETQEPSALQ